MYTVNRNELRIFRAICNGAKSTADLANALGISTLSVYRAAQKLSSSKIIDVTRTGKRLLLSPSPYSHSAALATYLRASERPIEPLIGSRLLVLLSVSSNPKSLKRVAKEVKLTSESVRKIVSMLKNFGAIFQEKRMISIPRSDIALVRFLQDYSRGACAAKLESFATSGTILWSEGIEFIFSSRTPVRTSDASETGITAMSKRGLQFISDSRYYHYAYWRPRLKREDIALHQILTDPNNTRSISYSLLFLMKEDYNPSYLAELGDSTGAGVLSRQVIEYLRGSPVENPHFPSRSDMARLRAQYGVS
jgi:predicted transcriptional regulator